MTDGEARGRLEIDNAELVRSNRELEEFAYVASHDLKSPLLLVQGFLGLLERTKREQLDDDARMYIDAALRGASRMEQLIDDLLTYSRLGRDDRDRQWVDLSDMVDDLLADWGDRLRAVGVTTLVGPLPPVLGDEVRLRQLFENLLSNAVKFRRTDVPLLIDIDATPIEGVWVFRVCDNGVGIPPEHRESIFTMFSRLAQTTDRPGSGIGLAICHKVVQAHGGRIWAADGTDGGAALCFTLPA